ncbi:hypothetical protein [Chitinophaga qingshengii]|uniref:Uncharacterized protein n=1 Tax=Chitinophaga qingshengii TaxID=1569794 RepID=A0ABR7TSA1_9BACT|nr:hypothetical protein [Chitinophaga qingshengii]MBC9933365.1 hypothetical protein [Chitinophaga qingshengii]
MMSYIRSVVWLCLFFIPACLYGQVPVVTLGPAVDEPLDGWDKLMQLKNGHTFWLHFSKKEGLRVAVYNYKRELVTTDSVACSLWDATDLESTEIDGIYEINGQPVIFLQQLVKYVPVFYRLILDPQTGKLLREDKLGELGTVQHRSVYVQENVASHDCYVEKDPNSDYYAVAFFNGAEIQRNDSARQRIRVMHFSPSHELINTGMYYLPDSSYSYFSYIHLTVQGKNKVYLSTVGFNTKRKGNEPWSKVIFSMLSPDSTTFAHHVLAYTGNYGDVSGYQAYLPARDEIKLVLYAPGQRSDGGSGIFLNTMMASGKLRKHHELFFPELSKNVRANLAYKDDYKGVPQRLTFRPDGSFTIQLEALTRYKQGNNQINKLHTNMGDIGVATLDTSGREDETVAVAKYQSITGVCEPFSLYRRTKSEWVFRNKIAALNTNTYLSYDYVQAPNATFVLFNDYLQYLDGNQDKGKKPLKYISDANFVCYRFYNNKSDRLFLFGAPEVTKGYYCMMGASDYDASQRVYATVMISRKGTEKKACVAWIQF